ncbi:MAG: hypothetical protein Q7U82_10510 [Gammaproteobacteria bacterium]|nr:hypothetical protein [Gammaproteobacteria bacterium]
MVTDYFIKWVLSLGVVIACMGIAPDSDAQSFGRIFSTADERAALDSQRDAMLRDLTEAERLAALSTPVLETVVEVQPTMIHMGGIVRRGDGTHTVWLNGVPVSERELPPNVQLDMLSGLGVLRVSTPTDVYSLRPGQTLNATTGELRESYQVTPEQIAAINAEINQRQASAGQTADSAAIEKEAEIATDADLEDEQLSDEEQSTMDTVLDTLRMLQEARELQESLQ